MSDWIGFITAIAAFLTALAALIAPIIKTHIENQQEVQLKRMEMINTAYKEFCLSYGALIKDASPEAKQHLAGAAYMVAVSTIENGDYHEFFKLAESVEIVGKDVATDTMFKKCLTILAEETKNNTQKRKRFARNK